MFDTDVLVGAADLDAQPGADTGAAGALADQAAGGTQPGALSGVAPQDSGSADLARDDLDNAAEEQPRYTQAQILTLRQEMAAREQQAMAQMRQYQDQLWKLQHANDSDEELRAALRERELAMRATTLEEAATRQAQLAERFEPLVKEWFVQDLVAKYSNVGVSKAALARFNDPDAMESYCNLRKEEFRSRQAQQRAQTGVDAAAGAGTGRGASTGRGWRDMSLQEQLAAAFAEG